MNVIYWVLLIPISILVLYFFYHLMFQKWDSEKMLLVLVAVNILNVIWQVLLILGVR